MKISNLPWKKLLKFCIVIALICFFLSSVSLFSSGFFLRLIKHVPLEIWIVLAFCTSFVVYGLSFHFKKRFISYYKIELLLGLGSIFFFLGLWGVSFYQSQRLEMKPTWVILSFIAFCYYGSIGYFTHSPTIWTTFMISLWVLFGCILDKSLDTSDTLPLKLFCLLGIFLMVLPMKSLLLSSSSLSITNTLSTITQVFGCLYFFIPMFGLTWGREHYRWNFYSLISSSIIMFVGIKRDRNLFSIFGLVFLIIGICKLYVDYFWNAVHKSLFFFILGLVFVVVGFYGKRVISYVFIEKRIDIEKKKLEMIEEVVDMFKLRK